MLLGYASFMIIDTKRREDGTPVVSASGELDLHTQTALREELEQLIAEEDQSHLEIDLQRVHFIDSSGVGLLKDMGARLRKSGRRLVLKGTSPQVRRTLSVLSAAGFLNL